MMNPANDNSVPAAPERSQSGKKTPAISSGFVKASSGSAGTKNVVASVSESGKKIPATSSGLVKASAGVERKRKYVNTQEDAEEMPEVLTNKAVFKMMRIEGKRIRDSVPKNPYRCTDMNAKKWTDKDGEDYTNWLTYKKGHLGLTLEEEEELASSSLNEPKNSKTYLG